MSFMFQVLTLLLLCLIVFLRFLIIFECLVDGGSHGVGWGSVGGRGGESSPMIPKTPFARFRFLPSVCINFTGGGGDGRWPVVSEALPP